ncbi:putative lipid-binding transport protein (Tim44 family) [Hydrogenophaga palleronii]|uniref:Lipid-binding transport protein (Tim44 family) n=1 Tax=Hydrogenophaga palleronii TaxID=65655 RepID=A0ABU1WPA7_9BURK|nr:Tim44-like domain-containing protein [Hydrogenophaga palleronii]MDR7151121.1 putative lipid-binding transport protein (Tim44 family) [Hydrogenophaga palleronii]
MNKLWSLVLVCALVVGTQDAFAKRLGGGFSFGKQSGNVTQRNTAPPSQQAAPQQAPAQSAATRPASAAPAAAAPKRPWGAMLGGLAAGLGLAWLASALGLGEAFAQILLFALIAVVVMAVVGMIMRSRQPATRNAGLAYQGASPAPAGGAGNAITPRGYSPQNVGNDASARPWERGGATSDSAPGALGGSMIGSALAGSQSWGVPQDFDQEGFLNASKGNFIRLQDAWDRSDMVSLRAMMTDDMLEQIKQQLADREQAAGGAVNKTEVVVLDAQLLGIEEQASEYMASVEFSGLIREDESAGPSPFREVWNITRPKSGPGGWLVAGVQALQ